MIQNENQITFNVELTEMDRCPYRGHNYFVPKKSDSETVIKIRALEFSLGGQAVCLGKEAARFFTGNSLWPETEGAKLHIGEANCWTGSDFLEFIESVERGSVSFYLYREGAERPIAKAAQNKDNCREFLFAFAAGHRSLQPGKYFLLVGNVQEDADERLFDAIHGHLCCPFVVMRAGGEMAHPVFRKAVASRPASVLRGNGYTSGALRVSLVSDGARNVEAAKDCKEGGGMEISVCCYNQDWHLMARTCRYLSGDHFPKSVLSFSFHSEHIWMPGAYQVVVSHNREPYMLLSFDYQGGEATECQCRPLTEESDEYWMVKRLEPDGKSRWREVRKFPGLAHLKRRFVALSRRNDFNRFCSLRQLDELRSNTFAVVTASKVFHAKRLAYCLPHLLSFGMKEYRAIDCEEWVKAVAKGEADYGYLANRSDHTLALYGLSALLTPEGREVLAQIEEAVKEGVVCWSLILCGTREEVERVFELASGLAPCFPADTRFDIQPPTVAEMVSLMRQQMEQFSLSLTPLSEDALAAQVIAEWRKISLWDEEEVRRFVRQGIIGRMRQRLQAVCRLDRQVRSKELMTVRPEDIDIAAYVDARTCADGMDIRLFEKSMKELDAMVGLHTLKEELTTNLYQVRFNEQRRQLGLSAEMDGTHHMIFTGNPGTGKTTVAGMIGKIYHSLGLLSKGEVIATERSQLVGRYIGSTEEKMVALLERAKGNVLFIDEAYALCDTLEDRKDFGNHVIESLLTLLARPHSDILVILAGYADEMERLMQMNQGLKGRFPYRFHFEDYDAGELMRIGVNLLGKKGYQLSDEAEALLKTTVADAVCRKDRYFGNARWINQFITSGILPAMARRVVQGGMPASAELYRTIEASDVEQAARRFVKAASPQLIPRRKIGFIA